MPFRLRLGVFLLLCLWCIFSVSLSASEGIMVIRIEGEKIILNRGASDNLKPDQELYVHRIGKPVGMIKTVLVDTYSSEAVITRLEPDETIRVGDVASFEPFSIAYTPPPPTPQPEPGKKPLSVPNDYTQQLKDHIRIATFKSGPQGTVKVDLWETGLLLNSLGVGSYTPYLDPSMLIWYGISMADRYRYSRGSGTHYQVTVAICHYDDELIESQARYFASKEGVTDESQILEIKNGIIQQMDAETCEVFHVKVHNGGEDTLQLSPFKWHMYLIDPMGQKVSASRCDEGLDMGLGPGQEAQGYIYYPRRNEAGAPNASVPVRIRLESILGGYADLSWR